ncbi:MAG: hypothetical protein ACT4O5_00990 [Gammaproteobacteria bacterium]
MGSNTRKTINLAVELRSGRHYGVFIDDTGSPGLNTPGLHTKRKSWVAVFIAPSQVAEVMDQLPGALSYLKEIGIEDPEFHFTDIWAGKGKFRKLDLQTRLGIFRFMADIFSIYRFAVLVQTFDPDNASDVQNRAKWPSNLGPLSVDDHEDLALIFLFLRVRQHLRSLEGGNATACIVVDEGRLANGSVIAHPGLAPAFCGGAILFASSREVHAIQVADFAAFVLNRWQLLRVKEKLTDVDKTLLEILSPVAECFVNIDAVRIHGIQNLTNLRDSMN